jgi:hypothetical protein
VRGSLAAMLAAGLLTVGAPAALAQEPAAWVDAQPTPPGASGPAPLGPPGDLQFNGPNRGLLAVQGTSIVPQGLFFYDGRGWRQLSVVCGGQADNVRIAWAGDNEFWTITHASQPRGNGSATGGSGKSLCHFRNGQVVASYSTREDAADPYRTMSAAACNGPNDCWFGGVVDQNPTGTRFGGFHLHWDGASLTSRYVLPGRRISDLEAHAGSVFESTFAGSAVDFGEPEPDPANPEDGARLLRRIAGGVFTPDPLVPADDPTTPAFDESDNATDVLALDSDGTDLWAVGGAATTGPRAEEGPVERPPFAARLAGDVFAEVTLDPAFQQLERLVDVAALPGSDDAWAAIQRVGAVSDPLAPTQVARLSPTGLVERPDPGIGAHGLASKIACPAENDCWVATASGWLFHYTDGTLPPQSTDPAFARLIEFRPNEAAGVFVPDTAPPDDSGLNVAPPLELETEPPPSTPRVRRPKLKPILRNVKVRVRGTVLAVSFRLTRRARVRLEARKGKRLVASTRRRMLRPGRHTLRVRLSVQRWPNKLKLAVSLPQQRRGQDDGGSNDENTVVTGAGAARR